MSKEIYHKLVPAHAAKPRRVQQNGLDGHGSRLATSQIVSREPTILKFDLLPASSETE